LARGDMWGMGETGCLRLGLLGVLWRADITLLWISRLFMVDSLIDRFVDRFIGWLIGAVYVKKKKESQASQGSIRHRLGYRPTTVCARCLRSSSVTPLRWIQASLQRRHRQAWTNCKQDNESIDCELSTHPRLDPRRKGDGDGRYGSTEKTGGSRDGTQTEHFVEKRCKKREQPGRLNHPRHTSKQNSVSSAQGALQNSSRSLV
jgi:hypothetical protein